MTSADEGMFQIPSENLVLNMFAMRYTAEKSRYGGIILMYLFL